MNSLKKIVFLLLAFSLLQCNGQTEKGEHYPKEKIMTIEKFDKESFYGCLEKRELENPLQDITTCVVKLSNGNISKSYETTEGFINLISKPIPQITETYKKYYSNGILKEETERFIGLSMNSDQIKFGTSKYYDETGQLVKTVDESVKYESIVVKPLELFEILKKEPLFRALSQEEQAHFKATFELIEKENEITPQLVHKALQEEFILNPYDRENAKRVFLSLSKDEKKWFVVKDIYPFGQISFEVDAKTGKIANRQYKKEWRP